jgi:dipeptidyl aminopeptidase/acylaminoacyl peptidase
MDVFAVDPSGSQLQVVDSVNEIGIDGAVSVAPSGTKLAYTQTVSGLPPLSQIPPQLRSRFPRPPGFPTLRYADIDFQTSLSGGISYSFTSPRALAAYGRPAWSPDGKQVVISSGQPGNLHLFVLPSGTPNPTLVTEPPGDCIDARWSPDGSSIVFTLRNGGGGSQLYLVHPDGSGLERLSDGIGHDSQPDFSPDGRQVVFSSDRSGTWQLYVVPTSGGTPTRVVDDPGDDTRPAWSPDGTLIAYSSDRAEHDEVYAIQPNGQGERRLVSMPGNAYVQDWQPVLHTDRPVVHAYPSTGRRGGPVVLRYSAWSTVALTVEFDFEVSTATLEDSGSAEPIRLADFQRRGVRRYRVPLHDLFPLKGKAAQNFTFCVLARDAWGNRASRCSTYRARG